MVNSEHRTQGWDKWTDGLCSVTNTGTWTVSGLWSQESPVLSVRESCILFYFPLGVGKKKNDPWVSFQTDLSVVRPLLALVWSDSPTDLVVRIYWIQTQDRTLRGRVLFTTFSVTFCYWKSSSDFYYWLSIGFGLGVLSV